MYQGVSFFCFIPSKYESVKNLRFCWLIANVLLHAWGQGFPAFLS